MGRRAAAIGPWGLCLLWGCQLAAPSGGAACAEPQLENTIGRVVESLASGAQMGVVAYRPRDGAQVAAHRARAYFGGHAGRAGAQPRADHRAVRRVGARQAGVVATLVLRGSSDPSLDKGHPVDMAAEARQCGLRHAVGDLCVDNDIFEPPTWGRGWMWDDWPAGYSMVLGGFSVHSGALSVTLWPRPSPQAPPVDISQPAPLLCGPR